MAAPTSLLGQARAFARDFPRDQMPKGYLWDVVDYVPTTIDANLTGRGAWLYGSTQFSGDPTNGIHATYNTGDKLIVITTTGKLYWVEEVSPYTIHLVASGIQVSAQNPVQLRDAVVQFDETGLATPLIITDASGTLAYAGMGGSHKRSRRGTVYKSMLVTANAPGEESVVRFTVPGKLLTDPTAWDANSFIATTQLVTALGVLRTMVIVFHKGSAERIRGNIPPTTAPVPLPPEASYSDYIGDMFLEPLFDRYGCSDPKTITYWKDSLIFADEHGVHITDGAIISNLVSQGGILSFWRPLYEAKQSMCAAMFLDYYMITIFFRTDLPSGGINPPLERYGESVTLVCDLPRKQWFRLSNIPALTYIASGGSSAMERVWAGLGLTPKGTNRLARMGPMFFPALDLAPLVDDNGEPVLPTLETPWYRLGSQEGRKRVRFVYLSYDARLDPVTDPVLQVDYMTSPQQADYVNAGGLPATDEYTRYRLPVGKFPYGIAFRVTQTEPTNALRVFDLGVESQPSERSRV